MIKLLGEALVVGVSILCKYTTYTEKNVIYILTTEDHKKVVAKAKNLTIALNEYRLGTYNKTCNHEVFYRLETIDDIIKNVNQKKI